MAASRALPVSPRDPGSPAGPLRPGRSPGGVMPGGREHASRERAARLAEELLTEAPGGRGGGGARR